jgi:hypothetical protein
LTIQAILCQVAEIHGKPVAEIFTDFHLNLNDTTQRTGFALNRAYLGYKFLPDSHFAGTIIINAGTPEDLAPGSEPRRYAFFREASISYTDQKLTLYLGITGTRLFDFQQKFWGKRYVANTYQSVNGYGFVADLGIAADYRFNDMIKADITLMNGEGYNDIQLDNSLKTSLGFTITPGEGTAIRIYDDIIRINNIWQNTFLVFLGIRKKAGFIGAEFTHKTNLDLINGHNAFGISATGGVSLTETVELFGRFDYSTSSAIADEVYPWNYQLDGKFIVAGIQKAFGQNVKLALDYQGHFPYSADYQSTNSVFLNASFNF